MCLSRIAVVPAADSKSNINGKLVGLFRGDLATIGSTGEAIHPEPYPKFEFPYSAPVQRSELSSKKPRRSGAVKRFRVSCRSCVLLCTLQHNMDCPATDGCDRVHEIHFVSLDRNHAFLGLVIPVGVAAACNLDSQ